MINKTLKIVPTGHPDNRNFVQGVKSLRSVTGLGLKEAKDIMDAVSGRSPTPLNSMFTLSVYPEELASFIREMRGAGYDVTDMSSDWVTRDIADVNDLLLRAIDHKNYQLAKRLLEVLEELS